MSARPEETLPCDVMVAPATVVQAGCKVSTLLAVIENRRERADYGMPLAKFEPSAPVLEKLAQRVELLDALVLLVDACDEWLGRGKKERRAAVKIARKVIAKAQGRES